jgi:hypothetical protein
MVCIDSGLDVMFFDPDASAPKVTHRAGGCHWRGGLADRATNPLLVHAGD